MDQIELEKCYLTILENGIIRLETKENISLSVNDLYEIEKFYHENLKIKSGLFLNVFSKGLVGDSKSKDQFVNFNNQNIKRAEAIVITDIGQRVEADFYLKHKKANHPIKIFDNEAEAKLWLLVQ
jgi:hypothetical protein